jgi:hypothetical protein
MYFTVLSYPRTGSTVIQRIINTSNNFKCIGEKPMAINHMHAFINSLIDAQTVIPESLFPDIPLDDDRNPVFMAQSVDIDSVINYVKAAYVRHVLNVIDAPNIGWKENFISSYPDEKVANSEVTFIRRLFPDILFILNIRNPEDCARSSIWKFRDDALDEIRNRRQWIIDGAKSGLFGDKYILLDYDEWSNDHSKLINPLVSAGMNINAQMVDKVLSEKLTHISNI